MFVIRARRKVASERDFLDPVEKGAKFSGMYVSLSSYTYVLLQSGTNQLFTDRFIRCIIRQVVYIDMNLFWYYGPISIV